MAITHRRLGPALVILVAALLAGCGASPAPAASTPSPAATTISPAATTISPVATAPAAAPTGTTPTIVAVDATPMAGNPWTDLVGPIGAPPGWTVEPCEGQAPLLCVSAGEGFPGTVELFEYPLAQRDDVYGWMVEAGLEPGQPLDPDDPEQARRAREALRRLMADHMGVVEKDRAITYPAGREFVLLEPEEVQVGRLPGLFYGFAGMDEDGQFYERWLTYAALDGEKLYIVTAFYDPSDTPGSMPSDEVLLTFAAYLREIVAGLKLPTD